MSFRIHGTLHVVFIEDCVTVAHFSHPTERDGANESPDYPVLPADQATRAHQDPAAAAHH